jgi:hypothetical protein
MAVYIIDACYQAHMFVRHEVEAKDGHEAVEKIKQMEENDEAFWTYQKRSCDGDGPVWFELIAVKPEPV